MGRARRARKIAAAAAYGGGLSFVGIGAAGAVSYAVFKAEATIARRIVGQPFEGAPDSTDQYGGGVGEPIRLLLLGDSLTAGIGAENKYQTIGGIVAVGVSAIAGRPVQLTNVAATGAQSSGLGEQVDRALVAVPDPQVALVSIGGNDVTHRIDRADAVRHLTRTVQRLRDAGAEVVVATCPDLGTLEPLPQPLRALARHWSRDLAAAQTMAVVEAGGRTVSLADLLGREFISRPETMFSEDRFHPSPAGYARTAAALLPSVCAALGLWAGDRDVTPDRLRGEGVEPVVTAAAQAVREAGTEVSGTEVAGNSGGRRGRWAVLRHRRGDPATAGPATPTGADADADGPPGRPESQPAETDPIPATDVTPDERH